MYRSKSVSRQLILTRFGDNLLDITLYLRPWNHNLSAAFYTSDAEINTDAQNVKSRATTGVRLLHFKLITNIDIHSFASKNEQRQADDKSPPAAKSIYYAVMPLVFADDGSTDFFALLRV